MFRIINQTNSSFRLNSNITKFIELNQLRNLSTKTGELRKINSFHLYNIHTGNINNPGVLSSAVKCHKIAFRNFSSEGNESTENQKWPNFGGPMAGIPSPFQMLKNICKLFYIRFYVDSDVEAKDVSIGFLKALEVGHEHSLHQTMNLFTIILYFKVVSSKLAEKDFDGLKGLVIDEEIDRIRRIVENMNESLREELKIVKEDLIADVPFDVNLKTIERNGETKNIIEIVYVFHSVRNLKEFQKNMSIEYA